MIGDRQLCHYAILFSLNVLRSQSAWTDSTLFFGRFFFFVYCAIGLKIVRVLLHKQPQKWEWTLNLCRKICCAHGKIKMWIFIFIFFGLFSYFWWVFIALAMFEVRKGSLLFFYCYQLSSIYVLSILKWFKTHDLLETLQYWNTTVSSFSPKMLKLAKSERHIKSKASSFLHTFKSAEISPSLYYQPYLSDCREERNHHD